MIEGNQYKIKKQYKIKRRKISFWLAHTLINNEILYYAFWRLVLTHHELFSLCSNEIEMILFTRDALKMTAGEKMKTISALLVSKLGYMYDIIS